MILSHKKNVSVNQPLRMCLSVFSAFEGSTVCRTVSFVNIKKSIAEMMQQLYDRKLTPGKNSHTRSGLIFSIEKIFCFFVSMHDMQYIGVIEIITHKNCR